jgi:hypothetical protein
MLNYINKFKNINVDFFSNIEPVKIGQNILGAAITLVLLQLILVYFNNNTVKSTDFNSSWLISTIGFLLGLVINDVLTVKFLDYIKDHIKFNDEEKRDWMMMSITDVVNMIVLFTVNAIFVGLMTNKGVADIFSLRLLLVILLVVSGILMYNNVVLPFMPQHKEERNRNNLNNILKKIFALLMITLLPPLVLKSNLGDTTTELAGIVVGDLSATPM